MMQLNKLFVSLILLTLFSCNFVLADLSDLENNTYLGNSYETKSVKESVGILSEDARLLQEKSGENYETQIGIKQVTMEEQKEIISNQIASIWDFFVAEFKLLFELVKGLFYIFEMYIFLYVFFIVFPNTLISIKRSILKWYNKTKY